MMANPKDLQKFLDVWGPVVASLPTVINALEHQAELERHVAQLQAQAKEAQDQTKQALDERAIGIQAAQNQLLELAAKKQECEQECKAHEKTCAEAAEQASQEAKTKLAKLAAKLAKAEADVAKVDQELTARLAEADAKVLAQLGTAKDELAAIEQRRIVAETAFEALKAKLG